MNSLKTKKPVEMLFYMIPMLIYIITYFNWVCMWRNNIWMEKVGSDTFSILGAAIATACLYFVYKKAMGGERFFWFFIFLSCLSYTTAEIIWAYYELILKVEVPFPGLPDVFYLLQPILILVAILYLMLKSENIFISIRLFLDIFITMTVATALSWYYLIQPIFVQENVTFLFKAISVAYPMSDLGLIFGILSLSLTLGTFYRDFQYILLIMGISLFTIADSIYLYLNATKSYQTGSIIDPIWISALFLIAIAGLYSQSRGVKTQQNGAKLVRDLAHTVGFKHIAIPYISLFVLLLVMSVRITKMDSIIVGSVLGIVLISIRQIFDSLDNKHLLLLLAQSNQELEINKKKLENRQEYLIHSSDSMKIEARTDFLTGLYNRRYLIESLEKLFEQAKLRELVFSLYMIDIDHFKQINDILGHETGDVVLQQMAQIMTKNTHFEEIIGRFGGEEFIAILPDVGIEQAEIIADKFRKQIAAHIFAIGSQNAKVTVSIGVSQWNGRDDDDVQSIIARIDKALYMAKNKGRNCTVVL